MIKINLGCGWRNFGKDWYHIDGGDYSHLDSHDILNLPFDNGTVDLIYASHVIEYFDREEIVGILNKWKSKLKQGGILRLAVHNFQEIARLYCAQGFGLDNFLGPLYGKMDMGGKTIYHKTTYDFEGLKFILNKCGFSNIDYYNWRDTEHSEFDDHSQCYLPHMDKDNGTLMSLNMECKK